MLRGSQHCIETGLSDAVIPAASAAEHGRANAMSVSYTNEKAERGLILALRLMVGWVFLWAAIHHFGDDAYVAGFLSHTKTFHPIYAPIVQSPFLPLLSFLVEYGHLLIGLSLISGLLVRISAPFAILIMMLYWTAHMDFPFIDNINNMIVDYHPVYAAVLGYLIVRRAGHVFGLDGMVAKLPLVQRNAGLTWLTA
jgi:thiosulfate dehydrogenase (quinone) large subunit